MQEVSSTLKNNPALKTMLMAYHESNPRSRHHETLEKLEKEG
jgi:hypothetical protein